MARITVPVSKKRFWIQYCRIDHHSKLMLEMVGFFLPASPSNLDARASQLPLEGAMVRFESDSFIFSSNLRGAIIRVV